MLLQSCGVVSAELLVMLCRTEREIRSRRKRLNRVGELKKLEQLRPKKRDEMTCSWVRIA